MKLVWIAQDLHIGGGQRVICELSRQMAQRGHDVTIQYPKGRGGFQLPESIQTREYGWEIKSATLSILANMPAAIADVPLCDWVLCSMPISAFSGFAAAKLRGAKMLYYIMNDERILFDDRSLMKSSLLLRLYHAITDLAHKLPVEIAVNSQWTGTRVQRRHAYGFPVIPHGVDIETFKPDGDRLEHDDRSVIMTVGRRHLWKGLAELIQALNLLAGKGQNSFQLWIISQDDLDLSQARFEVRIIKPSGDEEIAKTLRSADVFVHPSWFEGFGLPPLEAMACGAPCVITDCGGVLEFARDGENCLLTPVRNPEKMADAIEKLLTTEKLRQKLIRAGIKTAAPFTWSHAADRLEEILIKTS
ncbi:MAG: glycosyltransferase family 4 protein [bacterium]|nr:glycosyltransferase family 4 protein [bacterium]